MLSKAWGTVQMFVVIKRSRCRKEGWEGVDWGEARTLQGSGVKDGKSLLWMKRTMRELEGKAETHSLPGDKTAEGVRKVEDNARAGCTDVPTASQAPSPCTRKALQPGVYRWGDAPSKAVYFA